MELTLDYWIKADSDITVDQLFCLMVALEDELIECGYNPNDN